MPRDADGLTPKQARFVAEYLIDLDAAKAARRAAYAPKWADRQAWQLLENPRVASAIRRAQELRSIRTQVTQDMVVRELARIGFGDQRAVMKWGPAGVTLRDSEELTDDEAALVAEASQTITEAGGTIRLKTHDKVASLQLLGKHLGMFGDKVDVTGDLVIGIATKRKA